MAAPAAPFGVYLHIPFCASKCDYCAFATWTDRHHLTDAYLAALAIDYQAELHSCDTDFIRFPGLRWKNPLRK